MARDLLQCFWLHLQIGTFSCRCGQLFLRYLLLCGIIRLNQPENAGQALFFTSSPIPLSLCLSLLECSTPTGFAVRVNHVHSAASTLTCTVRGCGPVQSGLAIIRVFTGIMLSRDVRSEQWQAGERLKVHLPLQPESYSHHHHHHHLPAGQKLWKEKRFASSH